MKFSLLTAHILCSGTAHPTLFHYYRVYSVPLSQFLILPNLRQRDHTSKLRIYPSMAFILPKDVPSLQMWSLSTVNSAYIMVLKLIQQTLIYRPRRLQRWHGPTIFKPIYIKNISNLNILLLEQLIKFFLKMRSLLSLTVKSSVKDVTDTSSMWLRRSILL